MPVMSLGIRSGVNWIRLNSSESDCASELTIKRLREAGHPFEDAMAAGEDGDQELIDDLVLPDDLPADLLADLLVDRTKFVEFGEVELFVSHGAQDRVLFVLRVGKRVSHQASVIR